MPIPDSLLLGTEPIRRKLLVVLLLVDVSQNMEVAGIDLVNTALEELAAEIDGLWDADPIIKVAVLAFSDVCHWVIPIPILPEDSRCKTLTAGGHANLGDACEELDRRLHRWDLFRSPYSHSRPILVFISGGNPTDEYLPKIEALKKNNWYKHSTKYAIPVSTNLPIPALEVFTDSKEAILPVVTQSSDLIKQIKMAIQHQLKQEGE